MAFDLYKQPYSVLVPYWVAKQLERNKLPLKTVYELDKLMEVTSVEDLAIMFAMNTDPEITAKFYGTHYAGNLDWLWSDKYATQLSKVVEIVPLTASKVDSRIFAVSESDAPDPQYPNPFEIKMVDAPGGVSKTFLIIVYPRHFGGPKSREYQKMLVREYLRQSYAFIDYDAVARDPLFKQYLRTTISEPA